MIKPWIVAAVAYSIGLTVEGVLCPPLLPVVKQQLRGEHHGPYRYHSNHHRQTEEEPQMGKHGLEDEMNTFKKGVL